VIKTTAFASLAGSLLMAGNAQAATEVANIAAGDLRAPLLLLPLGAALGWVGFNILGPAKNQLDEMASKNKSVAGAVGIGAASLLFAQHADAATEAMQLAAGDVRAPLLLLPLAAALGWVGFNILGPAKNQLDDMSSKNQAPVGSKKKSVAGAVGIGAASLLAAGNADAATEVIRLAASDNRGGLLLLLVSVALGWVAFNIGGPAVQQVRRCAVNLLYD
jgi:photosystem II PsbY protein